MDLPIVCSLTEAELQQRRRIVLDAIRKNAVDVVEIEHGYSYHFEPSSDILEQLANLVNLERQCCQFLTFKILVEPGHPIALEVTGSSEVKTVIADYFGASTVDRT